jgi:hypothetical protein
MPWRRLWARIVLGIGATIQILLLHGWTRHGATPGATRSIILLVLLLVVSIPSAIALRRWPRAAVSALAVGSIYVTALMGWTLYLAYSHATRVHERVGLPEILDLALTLGILATIPIALALAWSLRRVGPASETHRAISLDS